MVVLARRADDLERAAQHRGPVVRRLQQGLRALARAAAGARQGQLQSGHATTSQEALSTLRPVPEMLDHQVAPARMHPVEGDVATVVRQRDPPEEVVLEVSGDVDGGTVDLVALV